MKLLKKLLIGIAIFLVIMVTAAAILPSLFKDDIKAAIDKQIAASVNADVVFDVNNFSLSIFRHFPNITAEIRELGVFNRAPFEGEHLFVVERLDVEINLMDILFGKQMKLKGITLVKPQINVKVLKDGKANYDIAIPSADTVKKEEAPSKFSFRIDHWEVIDGDIVYDDQSIPYFLEVRKLQHTGSGDFTQDVFDLRTHSVADTVTTGMGAMQFLTNKRAEIDAVITISDNISKFTFKENSAKINDFALNFDGWFKMNPDNYGMDITFKSPENSFKSLLSLVPGVYTKGFKDIETKGELQFAGFVKGTYSEKQLPAFNVNLKVSDAMFKYPELPTAISDIHMDLLVDNKDGVVDNTLVDLKSMHLNFGANPVDARLLIGHLKTYPVDAAIKAKLNLEELGKMFPMEGLTMKGLFFMEATAKGTYDSIRKIIPAMNVKMDLKDGYVKASQFPIPLEQMNVHATVANASGKMAETVVSVPDFSMVMENEKMTASMIIQNLDDPSWKIKANGGIDLEKITKIFPLQGMTVAGLVRANLETSGKMSDVNAKRYDKLPTSGSASLKNFKYTTKDMPAVGISQASMSFDPKKIELSKMEGTIGRSDFSVNGLVSNYIAYVLNNEVIQGKVNFNSNLLDLNEFMTESTSTTTKDTTSFGVIPIPKNIDFTLQSKIATVKMMDYTMTGASGDIVVKNGVANLSGLKFNMLGGAFAVNGSYDPRDLKHPKYDFALGIQNLAIQQAAQSFSIVKTYAPIAGLVAGNFSTDFKVSGELKQNLMPDMGTVNGGGLIKVAEAVLTQSKLVSGITSLTNLNNTDKVTLKDVLMSASISNGRLSVKPFDVQFGSYATTVSGSTGLDGSIDYSLKMMVPAGQLGSQLQGFVNQYAGTTNPTDKIPLSIGLGGTYNDPKPKLLAAEQKEQVKQAASNVVEQKSQEAVKQITEGAKPEDVVKNLVGGTPKPDSTKKDSTKTDASQLLQNKLQNLLKKKKNE